MNLNPVFFCCCCLFCFGIQASAFDYFLRHCPPRCLLLLLVLKCCGVKCCCCSLLFCFVLLLEKYFYGDLLIYSLGCCVDVLLRERERKKEAPNRPPNHRLLFAACLYIFYCIYSFTLLLVALPSNRAVHFFCLSSANIFHRRATAFILFFGWLENERIYIFNFLLPLF